MITVHTENYRGGTNNLYVAMNWQSGGYTEIATSQKSATQAIKNLKSKMRRMAK